MKTMKNKPKHKHLTVRDLEKELLLKSDYNCRMNLKVI